MINIWCNKSSVNLIVQREIIPLFKQIYLNYKLYLRFIKVEILSNRGNKDYTCLYRFRVHGVPHDTDTFNG